MADLRSSTAAGPLTGFTIGITADRRWAEQAALFERRGSAVVHGPTITTLPLGEELPLRQATEALIADPPDAMVANTALGVRSWFSTADSWGLGPALHAALRRSRIYARGPKASGAIHAAGLPVVARASTERLSDVLTLVVDALQPGKRVAVQLDGSGGAPELGPLRRAGLEVVGVPIYRWTLPDDTGPAQRLAEAVVSGRVHAVTFTTGPAIRNWLAIADMAGLKAELGRALTDGRAVVGCVGPACTEAAEAEGLLTPHLVQPDAYRLGPLVRAVAARLAERRVRIQLGQTQVVLSGSAVIIGGEHRTLTDTEARLLATLASRPNVVFTKEQLRRVVWGDADVDIHAVEVAIGRLRKRLGGHGQAVRSIHRRGYTLRT